MLSWALVLSAVLLVLRLYTWALVFSAVLYLPSQTLAFGASSALSLSSQYVLVQAWCVRVIYGLLCPVAALAVIAVLTKQVSSV